MTMSKGDMEYMRAQWKEERDALLAVARAADDIDQENIGYLEGMRRLRDALNAAKAHSNP